MHIRQMRADAAQDHVDQNMVDKMVTLTFRCTHSLPPQVLAHPTERRHTTYRAYHTSPRHMMGYTYLLY